MSDLAAFVTYRQDPAIARFQGWDVSYSKDDATKLIQSQAGVLLPQPGEWLQIGILLRETDELIGDVALHAVPDEDSTFEIGFTVSSSNQRHGFAHEAIATLMNNLVTDAGAQKFVASTDRRNVASIKLLESLGFTHQPELSWTEFFKGEDVVVDVYEIRVNH